MVTGATGFLGGTLARRLHGMGWDVTALGRNPLKLNELEDEGMHPLHLDITKKESDPVVEIKRFHASLIDTKKDILVIQKKAKGR